MNKRTRELLRCKSCELSNIDLGIDLTMSEENILAFFQAEMAREDESPEYVSSIRLDCPAAFFDAELIKLIGVIIDEDWCESYTAYLEEAIRREHVDIVLKLLNRNEELMPLEKLINAVVSTGNVALIDAVAQLMKEKHNVETLNEQTLYTIVKSNNVDAIRHYLPQFTTLSYDTASGCLKWIIQKTNDVDLVVFALDYFKTLGLLQSHRDEFKAILLGFILTGILNNYAMVTTLNTYFDTF